MEVEKEFDKAKLKQLLIDEIFQPIVPLELGEAKAKLAEIKVKLGYTDVQIKGALTEIKNEQSEAGSSYVSKPKVPKIVKLVQVRLLKENGSNYVRIQTILEDGSNTECATVNQILATAIVGRAAEGKSVAGTGAMYVIIYSTLEQKAVEGIQISVVEEAVKCTNQKCSQAVVLPLQSVLEEGKLESTELESQPLNE